MTIQWFPGHMAKARRQVTEKLKLVDIIFELVDARLPLSSRNPMIDDIINQKPRLVILNKEDMADPAATKEWIAYFKERGIESVSVNSQAGNGLDKIVKAAEMILKEKWDRMRARGMKPRAMRAMIVGIPNVGKSTLINRIAKKNIAKTGNMPGITKAQQWIKTAKNLELLDTPGILWPKFEDPEIGYKLALTGAIKDSILNLQDVAIWGLRFMEDRYPSRLEERYGFKQLPDDMAAVFEQIGERRGCLSSGGGIDYDKVTDIIIRDVRSMQFGRLTLDIPPKKA
ncbi:ribosome biogenesis GTPase YlqF [Domibacillus enclensis]|uniref:Ribosome biogenesis GTPase A n=1 Tax=Domibacillus enclensis TaxID=1017273 RepID=A0A1N6UIJ8_9BACI|nr:ribosome biogenesis GTPase YlqF [Domibacillus enclensis]OXS78531.1 ribosome biogenesis GTPase YlqF [Domibacillus enclensis]SIQ65166.1 ribosome biogenesis GTPase A [Domibacillus enclensis]